MRDLCAPIEVPGRHLEPELADWLLNYGDPSLITMYLKRCRAAPDRNSDLEAVQKVGQAVLLPRDHVRPGFQRWQRGQTPKRALICFTGIAQKLNMPVQLFHALVADRFDLIFYLRDPAKNYFREGIPGVADSFGALVEQLSDRVPESCSLAVLGVSAGGFAAAQFVDARKADRVALFSPPGIYESDQALKGGGATDASDVRIIFASGSEIDLAHAEGWTDTPWCESIRWISSDSHATLREVHRVGQFGAMVQWLSGEAAQWTLDG